MQLNVTPCPPFYLAAGKFNLSLLRWVMDSVKKYLNKSIPSVSRWVAMVRDVHVPAEV